MFYSQLLISGIFSNLFYFSHISCILNHLGIELIKTLQMQVFFSDFRVKPSLLVLHQMKYHPKEQFFVISEFLTVHSSFSFQFPKLMFPIIQQLTVCQFGILQLYDSKSSMSFVQNLIQSTEFEFGRAIALNCPYKVVTDSKFSRHI